MKKIILFIAMISCGVDSNFQKIEDHRTRSIPSEFEPYLEMFEVDANKHNIKIDSSNLKIQFKVLDGFMVGTCSTYSNSSRLDIDIDPNYWNSVGIVYRTILMYHEFGHCFLKRGHVDHLSIMRPNVLYQGTFLDDEKALIDELFTAKQFKLYDNNESCEGH